MDATEKRLEAALKIVLNPGDYKVCEGCDSIVSFKTRICPNCHAYQFNDNINDIVLQANILGNREQHSVTKEDMY